MDSGGIAVIAKPLRRAAIVGSTFAARGVQPMQRRLFEITGLAEQLHLGDEWSRSGPGTFEGTGTAMYTSSHRCPAASENFITSPRSGFAGGAARCAYASGDGTRSPRRETNLVELRAAKARPDLR